MCLVLFSWKNHPRYKLIFAANRDEFYARETARAEFWEDHPDILGGRDLEGGGTWFGISRKGRWSAITNYRDFSDIKPQAPSRGALPLNFLQENLTPGQYMNGLKTSGDLYNGFNLLTGDKNSVYYFSNKLENVSALDPGIYGLSNHLLDTPWPKVVQGKRRFEATVRADDFSVESLFQILYDTDVAPDDQLPDTGIGLEKERGLSSLFIKMQDYGSRCSTITLIDNDNQVFFAERTFHEGIPSPPDRSFEFVWD